jgi:hypothetical protein
MTAQMQSAVPCDGCTRRCHNDLVRLLPGDNESQYLTQPHPALRGQLALAHKPNGDCVYLGERGCTIHDTKPRMCREMDCRNLARRFTFTQARKLSASGRLPLVVWQRGKQLLRDAE